MEQATFNLIDAINCSGIDNSVWGCSQGIESTKHHLVQLRIWHLKECSSMFTGMKIILLSYPKPPRL